MVYKNNTSNLNELLLKSIGSPDPMLFMLESLCKMMMEAEVENKVNAAKSERTDDRQGYRSGYRVRRFDTRMGTMYLMVPKLREGGYIPFFVTERKRSEAALIQVVQEAFVQGVSTGKIEKLAASLGIESISKGQVSKMTKELDAQVQEFRTRRFDDNEYPILWVDALYEKVRFDGRVINMAVQIVCGVNSEGIREILAVEPMVEESEESYSHLFESLKDRGLKTPKLVISDAHSGLIAAIKKSFIGSGWQRCKVHFMRNILAHVPHKSKGEFAAMLKEIWLAPNIKQARWRADKLIKEYGDHFAKAIEILESGLEDSLSFYAFETIDHRKISSTNMLERLNKEIRRRTRVVGIFPSESSYLRLVTMYLIEYSEDWSSSRRYIDEDALSNILEDVA